MRKKSENQQKGVEILFLFACHETFTTCFCWHVTVAFFKNLQQQKKSHKFNYEISGSNATVREMSPSSGQMSFESMSNDNSTYSSLDAISSSSPNITATITNNKRMRDLALCAVLLDEWLKELAAISQEQSIVLLTDTFINHF